MTVCGEAESIRMVRCSTSVMSKLGDTAVEAAVLMSRRGAHGIRASKP
jgi:hypothetical protein